MHKKNYFFIMAEGIFFTIGLVFFDGNTILPMLVKKLTGSSILVGLIGMAQAFCMGTTSLIAGNFVRPFPYKKKFILSVSSMGRLPLWVLALSLIFIPDANPIFWGILIIGIQFIFWFADGAVYTAWTDLFGKSVKEDHRGKISASIQVIAGILSIFAGGVVAKILSLDSLKFPVNYGLILLIAAILYTISLLMFTGVRETPSSVSERENIKDLFRRVPEYFKSSKPFAMSMGTFFLSSMATISLPFYIIYGESNFGLVESDIGILISTKIAGSILGGLLFGFIGDRFGHEKGIIVYTVSSFIPPFLAILVGFNFANQFILVMFGGIYFFIGIFSGGMMVFMNYMIDLVPADKRTLFAGLLSLVRVPSALSPVIGGILVNYMGYFPIFIIALVFTLSGLFFSFLLPPTARTSKIENISV